jgi:hypothetical protein
MKPGGAKAKGNGYEIKISRILSEWYMSKFKHDSIQIAAKGAICYDFFWRTAGSGAKATITKRGESSFVGDITFLDAPNRLKVWIDSKDRKDTTFDNILTGKFVVEKWYYDEIKKRDSLGLDKNILIIFKLYRKSEDYVFFPYIDYDYYLEGRTNFFIPSSSIFYHGFCIAHLKDFLNNVKKNEILDD